MDTATPEEEDETTWCLTRVGRHTGWMRLLEKTEVTIGRGLDVTFQLLSPSCPLMISRLHCVFKQEEGGHWTVTDKKSLNGVLVNGKRISAEIAHQLRLGDSIQLGVAISGTKAEYEYMLDRQPLKNVKAYLAKERGGEDTKATALSGKKAKRKYSADETEPSTSSKSKLYRCSAPDNSSAQPCAAGEHPQQPTNPGNTDEPDHIVKRGEEIPASGGSSVVDDLDNLQMYSQNILMLREHVNDAQKQVASLGGEPEQHHSARELLGMLRAKMHRMEMLERMFSETKKQLEAQKTQQQEELLKKQLEEALQEQKKVMEELALSRQGFEEILLAKNKELEVTKEEKEKARAQKEEVVTQVTEVLENELQCIICSELFIEAVILNCAHSFCLHCIGEWRRRKEECPICRQAIKSQTRCLALDNCIDRMVENLSLDTKARRQALVSERKAKPVEVLVIHDDDSSSGSGEDTDGSMASMDSSFSSFDSLDTGSSSSFSEGDVDVL